MDDLRRIRLLVEHRGAVRRFCKISFTLRDASIYLIPYAHNRRFFYGGRTVAERQLEDTFVFSEGIQVEREPHLSIHASGSVRVYSGDSEVAGPIHVPALSLLRGQHVASLSADAFDVLPLHDKPLVEAGADVDHLVPVEEGVLSGRLALYVNGVEPTFAGGNCRLTIRLQRAALPQPLFLGIKPIAQDPIGVDFQTGVTVIAGWDPTREVGAESDYLYIRGT